MAGVLISLAYAYRDKMRKEKSGVTGVAKTVLLLVAAGLMTTQSYAQEVVAEAPAKTVQYVNGLANSDFYIVLGMIIFELVVIIALLFVMRVMVRLMSNKYATEPTKVHIPFWDRFNQAVAIEKEQDILLDHNYDGIRELDNSLPPWWKYGFYLTIVIGVIYLYYYHAGGNGPSSYQEYIAEVEKGEADKAEYLAKSANNVDENTVKMLDATGIASGQNIFKSSCAACHAADGGGGVGPNLTDEYWLHGGSITEVFKSIKYGWPDKGMKSWKDDFSPKQIAELSSYVKSLQGTQPAAPLSVSKPFSIPPHDGAMSIIENTVPNDCAQSGKAVYNKWCGPAHMYMNISAQK